MECRTDLISKCREAQGSKEYLMDLVHRRRESLIRVMEGADLEHPHLEQGRFKELSEILSLLEADIHAGLKEEARVDARKQ